MQPPMLTVASVRHPAYAPQYVADVLGLFSARGIAVDLVPCPAGDSTIIKTLSDGTADMVLGSALFALRMAQEGGTPILVAQSNQHTRHWLMAREACPDFSWQNLRGKTVMVHPTNVPTPWVAFRQALFNEGIALDDIALVIGYSAEQSAVEFNRGIGDYLLIDPEAVDPELGLKEVVSVADALGPVPWSVYCMSAAAAIERAETVAAFQEAIGAAAGWLYENSAGEAARLLSPILSDEIGPLEERIARYQRARLWVSSAGVDLSHVARWQEALERGGLLPRDLDLARFCSTASWIGSAS